jgi:hypothetical protein
MAPNILSAICLVLAIIPVTERPASAKSKSRKKQDGVLAVYRAIRPNEPVPARNEKQGANLCAIEIMLQKIWNGWKASV